VLANNGSFSFQDNGVDFFAGGNLDMESGNGKLTALDPFNMHGGGSHAASAFDVQFGVTNGFVTGQPAAFPFHTNFGKTLNVEDFFYPVAIDPVTGAVIKSTNHTVANWTLESLLDSTPQGPSVTVITSVLAQVLPAQIPLPVEDENISGAARKALEEMGIYARDLTPTEQMEKALGQVLYLEVPPPTSDQAKDYQIAAARIPNAIALDVLRARGDIFGPPPAGQTEADWIQKRQDEIQDVMVKAYLAYKKTLPEGDRPDGVAFRTYLEACGGEYQPVIDTFNKIRAVSDKAYQLGLTGSRLKACQDALVQGFVPTEISKDLVIKAIFPDPSAAAVKQKEKDNRDKENQRVADLSDRIR
jgi:hypothetical protein